MRLSINGRIYDGLAITGFSTIILNVKLLTNLLCQFRKNPFFELKFGCVSISSSYIIMMQKQLFTLLGLSVTSFHMHSVNTVNEMEKDLPE